MIGQQLIERKLTDLLGADVTFDELKLSLLSGSIEFTGLRVGDCLTAARGLAKVAAARALKGEFIVSSVTIERPVVNVQRLPKRKPRPKGGSKTTGSDDSDKMRWKFDVEKVLIIDAKVNVSPKFSVEKLLLELKRAGDEYKVTLLADRIANLGQLRGSGTISGAADLLEVMDARAHATIELGDIAKVRFKTPKIRSNQGQLEFEGKITLAQLLALL